jgi:hypothetical protein
VHLAPSVDLIEIVLAEKTVYGKCIAKGGADCVIVDFLLIIFGRLHLVFRK